MTLEKTHELIAMHSGPDSGYNRNAARMVLLGEVMQDHGQQVADPLIREYGLEQQWETKPGTKFTRAFKS